MAETQYIKQFLNTGNATEGSLLIAKQIYGNLIEEVDKRLIPRSEAAIYLGPGQIMGSSIDINLEVENTMDVRVIAEGAEIPMDNMEYTSFNMKPVKYGVSIRITKEMEEDGMFELLNRNVRAAGKRLAENENSLVISDALENASNTVSGGAAISISNITRGMQYLEDADYDGTTLVVGNEVLNDLRNIDTFVEFNKVGNRDMLETGILGTIYGLNVLRVSTNAGMTTTTAYIYDRNHAYVIAEKRTPTMENFMMPLFDMQAAAITQRLKVRHLRANAICKITTT